MKLKDYIVIAILLFIALLIFSHTMRMRAIQNDVFELQDIIQNAYASETLLSELNETREKAGAEPVIEDIKLTVSAYKHWKLIKREGFKHDGWKPIAYKYTGKTYLGENLARNFHTNSGIVQAWWDSPSHKRVMLNTKFTKVGYYQRDGITVLQLSN